MLVTFSQLSCYMSVNTWPRCTEELAWVQNWDQGISRQRRRVLSLYKCIYGAQLSSLFTTHCLIGAPVWVSGEACSQTHVHVGEQHSSLQLHDSVWHRPNMKGRKRANCQLLWCIIWQLLGFIWSHALTVVHSDSEVALVYLLIHVHIHVSFWQRFMQGGDIYLLAILYYKRRSQLFLCQSWAMDCGCFRPESDVDKITQSNTVRELTS